MGDTIDDTIGVTDLDRNESATVRLIQLQRERSSRREEPRKHPKAADKRAGVRAISRGQFQRRPFTAVAATLAAGWLLGSALRRWAFTSSAWTAPRG